MQSDYGDRDHRAFESDGSDAPICGSCGVTTLPSEHVPDAFECENPDCVAEEM